MNCISLDFRSQMALYQSNVGHLELKMTDTETAKCIKFVINFALSISQRLLKPKT